MEEHQDLSIEQLCAVASSLSQHSEDLDVHLKLLQTHCPHLSPKTLIAMQELNILSSLASILQCEIEIETKIAICIVLVNVSLKISAAFEREEKRCLVQAMMHALGDSSNESVENRINYLYNNLEERESGKQSSSSSAREAERQLAAEAVVVVLRKNYQKLRLLVCAIIKELCKEDVQKQKEAEEEEEEAEEEEESGKLHLASCLMQVVKEQRDIIGEFAAESIVALTSSTKANARLLHSLALPTNDFVHICSSILADSFANENSNENGKNESGNTKTLCNLLLVALGNLCRLDKNNVKLVATHEYFIVPLLLQVLPTLCDAQDVEVKHSALNILFFFSTNEEVVKYHLCAKYLHLLFSTLTKIIEDELNTVSAELACSILYNVLFPASGDMAMAFFFAFEMALKDVRLFLKALVDQFRDTSSANELLERNHVKKTSAGFFAKYYTSSRHLATLALQEGVMDDMFKCLSRVGGENEGDLAEEESGSWRYVASPAQNRDRDGEERRKKAIMTKKKRVSELLFDEQLQLLAFHFFAGMSEYTQKAGRAILTIGANSYLECELTASLLREAEAAATGGCGISKTSPLAVFSCVSVAFLRSEFCRDVALPEVVPLGTICHRILVLLKAWLLSSSGTKISSMQQDSMAAIKGIGLRTLVRAVQVLAVEDVNKRVLLANGAIDALKRVVVEMQSDLKHQRRRDEAIEITELAMEALLQLSFADRNEQMLVSERGCMPPCLGMRKFLLTLIGLGKQSVACRAKASLLLFRLSAGHVPRAFSLVAAPKCKNGSGEDAKGAGGASATPILLSFSVHDPQKRYIYFFARVLKRQGFTVWMSSQDSSSLNGSTINRLVEKCVVAIVFVSREYEGSAHCRVELSAFHRKAMDEEKHLHANAFTPKIIFVCVDPPLLCYGEAPGVCSPWSTWLNHLMVKRPYFELYSSTSRASKSAYFTSREEEMVLSAVSFAIEFHQEFVVVAGDYTPKDQSKQEEEEGGEASEDVWRESAHVGFEE